MQKICKICRHKTHIQNMQKYATKIQNSRSSAPGTPGAPSVCHRDDLSRGTECLESAACPSHYSLSESSLIFPASEPLGLICKVYRFQILYLIFDIQPIKSCGGRDFCACFWPTNASEATVRVSATITPMTYIQSEGAPYNYLKILIMMQSEGSEFNTQRKSFLLSTKNYGKC